MLILIGLFVLGGLFSGFTAGLFGIGGGSFLIPMFLYLLPKLGTSEAQVMHQAVATSLAIIVPSTLSASYEQYKLQHLDVVVLKKWIPPVFLGLVLTSLGFHRLSSSMLQIIFIIYLLCCAGYMLFSKKYPPEQRAKSISRGSYYIAGFLIGVLSVLLGIGGGTMTTPYFTWYCYPFKKAIAISSVTGVFIGILGSISMIIAGWHQSGLAPYSLGYVSLFATAILTPFCLISARVGAKVGNQIENKTLNLLYISFLLCIAGFVALHLK